MHRLEYTHTPRMPRNEFEQFKSSLSVGTFCVTVCTCQMHVIIENPFINFVKTEDIMFNKDTLEIGSGCVYMKRDTRKRNQDLTQTQDLNSITEFQPRELLILVMILCSHCLMCTMGRLHCCNYLGKHKE